LAARATEVSSNTARIFIENEGYHSPALIGGISCAES
jgi:hypothetical protein